ncbi:hypothetical protein P7H20_00800 [Paenibacillus larvae]|nr:hypothetical protein [Paenibacillus larvae]MDT2273710.1 hypothetical protein [Paenibacillus larvae]
MKKLLLTFFSGVLSYRDFMKALEQRARAMRLPAKVIAAESWEPTPGTPEERK